MPIEEKIVRCAAPTLLGLKVANLINLDRKISDEKAISYCRAVLSQAGLCLHILSEGPQRRLVLLYRSSALQKLLDEKQVQDFLSQYGYDDFFLPSCLDRLTKHCSFQGNANDYFPHEIGLFLGYPLADVRGYIVNRGKGAKLTGYWKVYDDVASAAHVFSEFKRSSRNLTERYCAGASLMELSVAG